MDIVARLKVFLSQNGISNSQFADTCEIPRPTISQLLNGRNKKVSDEVISKIHAAYPSLNIIWLLFGDGDMFVPNQNSQSQVATPQVAEKSKMHDVLQSGRENKNASQASISFGDSEPEFMPPNASQMSPTALSTALENIARSVGRSNTVNASKDTDGRRIVNIMVFYSDNSFESFTPNR